MMNIWIAGDSTAANKEENKRPETGWGEKISTFLIDDINIENHATNGRSTKSFIDEMRFDKMIDGFKKGDFLFIQFGHNDEKINDPSRYTHPYTTYQENLKFMVDKAKEKGVTPVLLSSVPRRKFLAKHRLSNRAVGLYPYAMKMFAKREKVIFIDVFSSAKTVYEYLGFDEAKKLFNHLNKGEHLNYPDGISDNTHFNDKGAYVMANIIAKQMTKKQELQKFVNQEKLLTNKKIKAIL